MLPSLLGLAITSSEPDNVHTCGITFSTKIRYALDVQTASHAIEVWLTSWMLNVGVAPPSGHTVFFSFSIEFCLGRMGTSVYDDSDPTDHRHI